MFQDRTRVHLTGPTLRVTRAVLRTAGDPALQAAWSRFSTADRRAVLAKQSYVRLRLLVLAVGFGVAVLAVINVHQIALVVLPLLSTGLIAYMVQFSSVSEWVSQRALAEQIRSQLYLYRLEAAPYAGLSVFDQQQLLAVRTMLDQPVDDGPLPVLPDADPFGALSAARYASGRVAVQRDWYVQRAAVDVLRLQRWRLLLVLCSFLGSVALALGWQPLVVFLTACAGLIGLYSGLRLIGESYLLYRLTAARLDRLLLDWQLAADGETAGQVLAEAAEQVLAEERAAWQQTALRVGAHTEQRLNGSFP